MATPVKPKRPAKSHRTKPIPVAELMFAFRTINAQGETAGFLKTCAERGYTVRVSSEFFDFAVQQARQAAENAAQPTLASTGFATAMHTKDWDDCTKKKKGYFA